MKLPALEFIIKARNEAERTIKEVEQQLGSLGKETKNIEKLFKQGALVGTAAFGAVAGAVMKSANDFEKAQAIIVKSSGASNEELERMMDITRELNKIVPQSLDEVATAVSSVSTYLELEGEELEKTSKKMLDFARVSGTDVATATRSVARLTNSMGIEMDEASLLLDKLTWASQKSGIEASRLADTITEAGPAFEELGFSVDRSIGLFAQFEKYGAKPEEVVSSLGKALNTLANEGFTNAEEAFNEYLKRVKEAPDILQGTLIANELFGARTGGKIADDIRAGRFEVEEWEEALKGAEGILDQTAKNSETLSDKMNILKKSIFDALFPGREFNEVVGETIDKVIKWVQENSGLIKNITIVGGAIGGLIAVVSTTIIAIGKAISIFNQLREAFQIISTLFQSGPAIIGALTSPVGLVVVGIGALIAIIVALWKNWDTVWEWITNSFNWIVDKFKTFGNWIGNIFTGIGDTIKNAIGSALDWVNQRIEVVKGAIGFVSDIGSSIGSSVGKLFGGGQFGIDNVPRTGMYMLHKGEQVVPAGAGAGSNITVNINGGYYLDERVAEDIGNTIIEQLKRQMRL